MLLNPWRVSVFRTLRERVTLDIIHEKTGETRRLELGADDINNILTIGLKRIATVAEILNDGTANTEHLVDIIGEDNED